jgi:hypothetical protein
MLKKDLKNPRKLTSILSGLQGYPCREINRSQCKKSLKDQDEYQATKARLEPHLGSKLLVRFPFPSKQILNLNFMPFQ